MARRSWPIEAVVEVVSWLRGSDSVGIGRGFNSATIWTGFSGGFSVNFTSKAPRLGHDRASIVVLGLRRSSSARMAAIPPRMLPNRGSIAPRSRLDRTAIVEFFHNSSTPSDRSSGDWRVTIARSRGPRLRGASAVWWKKIVMMIAIATPSVRWGSVASASSTWHQVSRPSNPLTLFFSARALMDDRVDSGPRDRWFPPRSDARRVATSAAKGKTCGT